MSNNSPEGSALPNKRYFKLCSGCGICNDKCTVNFGSGEDEGSRTTPQDIARHLLTLEQNFKSKSSEENIQSPNSPTYICTACEMCTHVCPYFVPFFRILIEGREWIQKYNVEEIPKAVRDMEQDIFRTGNPFGNPAEKRDEWIKDDFPEQENVEAVYYPGCQNAYQLFNMEKAILKILQLSGVKASYPGKNDKCCGRPLYFSGRSDDIEEVAKSNVDIVRQKKGKELIASCSSCYLAFKKNYPPIVGKLPFEVYHTTEYFNKLIKENKLKLTSSFDKKVIYHDPCELSKVGGIIEPPREILRSLPGVELLEFDKNRKEGLCCGGGGLFEAVDEKQAFRIGELVVLEAAEKDAEILATACPTCNTVFNMSKDNLIKSGKIKKKLKIMDISEIILKCMK